jgi:hypothetical protein
MSKVFNFENYVDCVVKIIPLNVAALTAMTLSRIFLLQKYSTVWTF